MFTARNVTVFETVDEQAGVVTRKYACVGKSLVNPFWLSMRYESSVELAGSTSVDVVPPSPSTTNSMVAGPPSAVKRAIYRNVLGNVGLSQYSTSATMTGDPQPTTCGVGKAGTYTGYSGDRTFGLALTARPLNRTNRTAAIAENMRGIVIPPGWKV
jgi:hypothetical protein